MIGIAFVLVLLSAVLHAVWNFLTKRVSGNLSVLYIGITAMCVALLPFVLFFLGQEPPEPSAYSFIIATGVVHALYFFVLSKAYKYGNISTVYPVARGFGVIGTAIAAILWLNESVSFLGLCGIVSTGLGIFVIGASVTIGSESRKGLWFALLVGCTMIGYSIIDKSAMSSVNPVIYIFWLFLLSMLLLTPYMIVARRHELVLAWKQHKKSALIIGLGATAGYLLILYVFSIAQVSYVVAVRESSVVLGSFFGVLFLHEAVSIRKLIGIIMVVAGLIMVRIA